MILCFFSALNMLKAFCVATHMNMRQFTFATTYASYIFQRKFPVRSATNWPARDAALNAIIEEYGLPPMWTRPNIFQSLILTILEQQVSLASAYAAYQKLKAKIGFVTPAKILSMTDDELRACYFSRQKTVYARDWQQP